VTTFELVQALPVIEVVCYAGQPLTMTVPILGASGSPISDAGLVEARAQVRTRWESDEVLYRWEAGEGNITITGGAAAVVTLTATSTETALWQEQWPKLAVVWDLEVIDTLAETRRLCALSPFTLLPNVTQE
jgi:hypothetical protein